MSLTDRDRKIMLTIVPLVALLGFWFLALSPKRQEAAKAEAQLTKQEQRRDQARARVAATENSKRTFASDYTSLVRLGKAVPARLDMPGVIVQLEAAAEGTGISFKKIATGEREQAPGSAKAQPPAAPGQGNGSQPAAAGGAPAQSAPGGAAESAGNSANNANNASASAEKSGVNPADTQTSTQAGQGGAAQGSGTPGLDSVPLDLEFQGSFFRLADFFHSLKRFVRVANERISVRGRLLTVESLKFTSDPELFPRLNAELKATVYLAPVAQGTTAGATPQGPAPAAPSAGQPAVGGGSAAPAPAATAAPAGP